MDFRTAPSPTREPSRIICEMRNLLLAGVCAALFASCAASPSRPHASRPPAPAPVTQADAVVKEAWISTPVAADELDSVAAWPTEDGHVWLIATAKSSHRLAVYDADSGARLLTFGERGQAAGQFNRPNGIAVFGDLLFVAERDNHRVQVLQLPEFTPLAILGEHELKVPYGLWLEEVGPDQLDLFVTDSFMADFRTGQLPPMDQLNERVKRFRVSRDAQGAIHTELSASFGATDAQGALRMVESIAGDPAHDRLLIADEDRRVGSTLRDYSLAGAYRQFSLPAFDADAEGVALWACSDQSGYWIAVDQLSPTLFRVFDRASLAPRGIFRGEQVANTDGETLYAAATPRFPNGALFVLHNDQSLAAFDLRDVASALKLGNDCVP